MKIVTSEQMRRIEDACEAQGVSKDSLMEKAGLATAVIARNLMGGAAGRTIVVLVGPGNNGGDGLVAARFLAGWGASVTAWTTPTTREEHPKTSLAKSAGVSIRPITEASLDGLKSDLQSCDVVLDAVLGIGRSRPLEGLVREAMLLLRSTRESRASMQVVALDVPTGMDADSGAVDLACPEADVTISYGFPKTGHYNFPGADFRGKLEVADLGIPSRLSEDIPLELLSARWVSGRLPARPSSGHKGTFGHALVVAGSRNYVGAAYLAAQAAARSGAGLVTLASPSSVYPIAASKLAEVIHLPLPDDDGRFHPDGANILRERLGDYDSLIMGCGFGRSPGLVEFMGRLLLDGHRPTMPIVVDADGLNSLSQIPDWWERANGPLLLTPHPGEMATLTGLTVAQVQADRIAIVRDWSNKWGTTLVLKGAFTAVASPGDACRIAPFANPTLASGGTGDVLTGVIGGLLAQGLTPEDAACCGVYIHGEAGESVRREIGETGALAGDLLDRIPRSIATIKAK